MKCRMLEGGGYALPAGFKYVTVGKKMPNVFYANYRGEWRRYGKGEAGEHCHLFKCFITKKK